MVRLFPFHRSELIVVYKADMTALPITRMPKGESTMAQFVRQPISDPHAEEKPTTNLHNLLAKVQRAATFRKMHHGIQ